jgi:ferrous-iron efflux pump FieF
LIIIKAIAYHMNGSMGILSSLTDSTLDSLISIMALASVYYASQPADSEHRWGHGKMEAVSALFQAAVITGGGLFLISESLHRLSHPHEMQNFGVGMIVMLISIAMSILLVWIQRRSLAESKSLAIEADSLHYSSDVLINSGALLVIFLTMQGAPYWVDALFALGVALFMGKLAYSIARKSLDMLMDKELPEEERKQIIKIIEAHDQVAGWHDLRTRQSGAGVVITFDIEANPAMILRHAHAITKDLEREILKLHPDADILIHVDPEGDRSDARHRVKGVHV